MKTPSEYVDLTIQCCDCSKPFIFSAGEQRYFFSKGLTPPRRCGPCRERRRSSIVPDPAVSNE